MTVAALYDVHGMPHALEAVLADLGDVDAIVFGGDVFWGRCRGDARARALRRRAVRPRQLRARAGRAAAEKLGPDAIEWARAWPTTLELDGVLYCHATPRDDTTLVVETSSDERFADALDGVDARLVVGGHTHMQFTRGRWVNAGSVGMPYEGEVAAFWALVGDDVEFRKTPFDVERASGGHPRLGLAERRGVRRGEPARARRRAPRRSPGSSRVSERVTVGRVGKPHGIKGAFFVEDASEDPERFAVGAQLYVDGERAEVVESKRAGGRPVIRLDREPRARRRRSRSTARRCPPPVPDEYYVFQLVGLDVERADGVRLGRVANVEPGVANDVLELDSRPAAAARRRVRARSRP